MYLSIKETDISESFSALSHTLREKGWHAFPNDRLYLREIQYGEVLPYECKLEKVLWHPCSTCYIHGSELMCSLHYLENLSCPSVANCLLFLIASVANCLFSFESLFK